MQVCSCSASTSMARTLLSRRVTSSVTTTLSNLQQQIRAGSNSAARVPLPSSSGGSSDGGSAVFKTFKPLTPSLRHVRMPVHPHLHKGKPYRDLTVAQRKTGGRNNTGHITTRFRAGGHKRRLRNLDFRRLIEGEQTVERIEYDPGRTAHIALIRHGETGEVSYILAPEGLRAGDKVQSWPNGVNKAGGSNNVGGSSTQASLTGPNSGQLSVINTDPQVPQTVDNPADTSSSSFNADLVGQPEALATSLLRASMLRTGNQLPLHLLTPGTTVHCISLQPNGKAVLCRSAGSSAKIVATTSSGSKGSLYAQIQLTSGEVRKLNRNCTAVVGSVSNREHQNRVLGKAGRSRWLGRKPRNRGVSMNAVDHPHGGGRGKSKGNKHPRTPQGILTKGKRTRRPGPTGNKMVVRQRPRGPEKRSRK